MYVHLYLNGRKILHWHFENPSGIFAVQDATEARTKEWNRMLSECRIEADSLYQQYDLVITIPSRLSPKDIPDDEFKAWDREVTSRQLDNLVEKTKPEFKNGKLE